MSNKKTHQFETEINQLLRLIIDSMYSNREIFLRELISNASDAIDKLRFKSQTETKILGKDTEFKIKLTPDKDAQTLEISDNGIGMTYDEIIEDIGTIAKSGTSAFLSSIANSNARESLAPELIGQFGVGFYSAFIVSEKITIISKAIGSETAVKWESTGEDSYTIEETTKDGRGTTIILNLKKPKDNEQDFTDEWVIRQIVKKHSDYVQYPVLMDVEREEPVAEKEQLLDRDGKPMTNGKTQKVIKEETLNSMKAIWIKDKKEVTDEEYNEFYQHVSHDWNPPLAKVHLKFEGTTEYYALLYIPSKAPFDMINQERKHGVDLYCKRVFIMENCKELMPEYFSFIKGVVDAPDLNLNVSREILQQDILVRNIKKNLMKKIFELLDGLKKDDYETFYNEFGSSLKLGIHTDFDNREKIANLILYKTTKSEDKYISLKDYIANMQPDQKDIYYITGENIAALLNSPHLETLKEKGYEVLLMNDPIDEWVVQSLPEFEGKKLKSAEKGDLGLNQDDAPKKEQYNDLFEFIKTNLESKIKEVVPSTHLKDSVACLSGDDHDMSAYMEKIMKSTGQESAKTKRVLELNLDHPVITKIQDLLKQDKNDPKLKDYCNLLFDLATVVEGGKIENPSQFSKLVGELMSSALI